MTSIGLLAVVILTSLLLAGLDMLVYRVSYFSALSQHTFGANKQSYIILAAAVLLAVVHDLRMRKRTKTLYRKGTGHHE